MQQTWQFCHSHKISGQCLNELLFSRDPLGLQLLSDVFWIKRNSPFSKFGQNTFDNPSKRDSFSINIIEYHYWNKFVDTRHGEQHLWQRRWKNLLRGSFDQLHWCSNNPGHNFVAFQRLFLSGWRIDSEPHYSLNDINLSHCEPKFKPNSDESRSLNSDCKSSTCCIILSQSISIRNCQHNFWLGPAHSYPSFYL